MDLVLARKALLLVRRHQLKSLLAADDAKYRADLGQRGLTIKNALW